MSIAKQKTAPTIAACLGFDTQAEEAAKFYTAIFKNSRINNMAATSTAKRLARC
jgi:predicted 3-demethylubiquinone-9 3-methyltransferase (glyoxalase superfamily)